MVRHGPRYELRSFKVEPEVFELFAVAATARGVSRCHLMRRALHSSLRAMGYSIPRHALPSAPKPRVNRASQRRYRKLWMRRYRARQRANRQLKILDGGCIV